MDYGTYSFTNVSLAVNGREITGYFEGDDAITAMRREDAATDNMGPDGSMAVAISADKSGEVTFRLKQTSSDNGFMHGLVNSMQTGSFTNVSVQIRDSRRRDLVVGTIGYVKKGADFTRGKNINVQEWTIVQAELQFSQRDGKSDILDQVGLALGIPIPS